MEELKKGDIVCLKSEKSIKMTIRWTQKIIEKEENKEACCDWFVNKKLFTQVFPLTSLVLYKTPTVGVIEYD
jgi:hypothetical protein